MLLATRWTPVEVRAHPGYRAVRISTGTLDRDVAVELREALVAPELGGRGAEEPCEQRSIGERNLGHVSFVSGWTDVLPRRKNFVRRRTNKRPTHDSIPVKAQVP